MSAPKYRRVVSVVGARPNFMKLAPVARALRAHPAIVHYTVHTGQHYDDAMSATFFGELDIPKPVCDLGVGSGSHATQTATAMQRLEPVLKGLEPDLVLLYGDVNSTLAAALVAAKLGFRTAHVEAGLRSGDWSMPEEINRVLTDRIAGLLFTPSADAAENLRSEGIPDERICFVGNVMIDTLVAGLSRAAGLGVHRRLGLTPRQYTLVTLHRPASVDDPGTLADLLATLSLIGRKEPVVFPVHPRTRERMEDLPPLYTEGDIMLLEPIPYLEMLALVRGAHVVITDSGGLQEETTFLGVPCLTVRPNTERPITCSEGTNRLVPARGEALLQAYGEVRRLRRDGECRIRGWDGRAGERIAAVIAGVAERRSADELVRVGAPTRLAALA